MDVDLWEELPRVFDAVHPGLLQALLGKSLLKDEGYKALIRAADGEEYEPNKFQDARVAAFRLVRWPRGYVGGKGNGMDV